MPTSAATAVEHVLCVPTLLFHEIGYFQGFQPNVERYLSVLLDPLHTSFRPRDEVENDPSFKQLIPYCIFRYTDRRAVGVSPLFRIEPGLEEHNQLVEHNRGLMPPARQQIFHYTRGKAGGEGRLHSKRSIGIGGHISSTDPLHGERVYAAAMHREIAEEVSLGNVLSDSNGAIRDECVGLINDDETAVGKVHLGIVHVFDLESAQVLPREDSILQTGFASPAELLAQQDQFESWSQICLAHLWGGRES